MATIERKKDRAAIESLIVPHQGDIGLDMSDMNSRVEFDFADGRKFVAELKWLSPKILERLALHGLNAKLLDAAAKCRDKETGASASLDQKYTAMAEVHDALFHGEWSRRVAGGSGPTGLLEAALVRLYPGKDIKAWLEKKSAKEQAAMRGNTKVRDMIEEIKAERAAKGGGAKDATEVDSMLSELEGE